MGMTPWRVPLAMYARSQPQRFYTTACIGNHTGPQFHMDRCMQHVNRHVTHTARKRWAANGPWVFTMQGKSDPRRITPLLLTLA